MPFAVERIDHVEVFVRDLEAAAQWYADVLGLREVTRWDPYPIMIGAGGTMLALFQADGPRPAVPEPRTPHWRRVAFRTDAAGFKAAQEHLASQGVAFEGPVDHERAWSIYFTDPDGNTLEITTYDRT